VRERHETDRVRTHEECGGEQRIGDEVRDASRAQVDDEDDRVRSDEGEAHEQQRVG